VQRPRAGERGLHTADLGGTARLWRYRQDQEHCWVIAIVRQQLCNLSISDGENVSLLNYLFKNKLGAHRVAPEISHKSIMFDRKTYTEKGGQAEEWHNGRLVLAWATPCRGEGSEAIDQLGALISADEVSQASRFRFVDDQNAFLFAHALTRVMLSALLPRSPPEWEFVAGPFGRSRLRRGQTGYPVSFSLSHTRGLAACALGVGVEVGVDVESCETARLLSSDGDWLTRAEREALRALAPEVRGVAAVKLWTLKEAVTKTIGLGLYQRFGDVGFTLDPPRFAVRPPTCVGNWWFTQTRPTPAHVIAVAAQSNRREVTRAEVEVLPAARLVAWQRSVNPLAAA
jgi:4'-phosphopantetheinyl transferase